MDSIGNRLAAWLSVKMQKSGYSAHGLAVMTGLTHPTILALKDGKITRIDLEILAKIAGAFDMEVADAVVELEIPKIERRADHPRKGRPLGSTKKAAPAAS